MTPRTRQAIFVRSFVIDIDVAVRIRQHFLIRSKGQISGISRLHSFLIGSAHTLHIARPANCTVILVIELYSEAAWIITLSGVHERRNVSVIEKALIVHAWLSDKFCKENFEPCCDVRDK